MESLDMSEVQALKLCRQVISQQKTPQFAYHLYFLALSGLGVLNFQNAAVSGEKNFIENILPKLIAGADPVIFDVGAYHGDYARLLHNRFPAATIHCFEPHPKNFQILEQVGISNMVCHNIGLGDSKCATTIYDRSDMQGSSHASLYSEVIEDIHKQGVTCFDVAITTIDEVVKKEDIACIDFLKIDTEGHELAVLKGASNALDNEMIRCIQFEFNEMNVVSRTFLRDFKNLLQKYVLFRLLPTGLIQLGDQPVVTEIFAFQNIVAIPSASFK